MSAVQPNVLPYPQQALTEGEALQRIGRHAVAGKNFEESLDSIFALALRVVGVAGIAIDSLAGREWVSRQSDSTCTSTPQGAAVAEIAAGGRGWGTIRVFFSLTANGLESPLRFTRFIGQQIGLALSRIELLQERELARRSLAALKRRLLTYKYIQRAKGILAQKRSISEHEALRWICQSARGARRSLIEVSETIIFLEAGQRQPRPPSRHRQAIPRSYRQRLPLEISPLCASVADCAGAQYRPSTELHI